MLVSFDKDKGGQLGLLHPFAHIGIEVPDRSDVDDIAERARELGCLHWEPRQMPRPVGYICAVKDPDGNVIEISHDQQVFDTVRRLWAS
ncbi:VOC family protein [Solwaraspora sp. WMMB335]|uniref:VOC family protein n=1 Tax=Solwaraspora sp. WMMB335 TaxID=3404118 RepID=UPI003B924B45